MASEQELLLVELTSESSVEDLLGSLRRQLPAGIEIVQAGYVSARAPVMPAWSSYQLILTDRVDLSRLEERIVAFTESTECRIDRAAHGRHPRKTIDLREAVSRCEVDGGELFFTVRISPEATPRVSEIRALLGLERADQVRQVCRVASGYDEQLWPDR